MEQTSADNSPPVLPSDSPGSSVSSRLQEEYNELLKYAVMLPGPEGHDLQGSLPREGSPQQDVGGESVVEKLVQGETGDAADEDQNQNATCGCKGKGSKSATVKSARPQPGGRAGVSSSSGAESCVVDCVVKDMGGKLDGWLCDLRGNILSALRDTTIQAMECQRQQQDREMKQLQCESQQLQQEVNRLSELVHTCEQSLARKDSLVDNLTSSLAGHKEKTRLAQAFFNWRVSLIDAKREAFTSQLSQQHHQRVLSRRVLKSWFGLVQSRWRSTVQRQCQAQAQGVCKQLADDYEAKIAQLNSTVEELQAHVAHLQRDRESYTDNVKKAFMRGVCALNMEAMSAFTGEDTGGAEESPGTVLDHNFNSHTEAGPATSWDVNLNSDLDQLTKDGGQVKSLPYDPVTSSIPDLGPYFEVTPQQPASFAGTTQNIPKTKSKSKSAKTSGHPRSTAASGFKVQGQPLAPPMASVVVERHQPITKQTVGKATAIKYPKSAGKDNTRPGRTQSYLPLAGQSPAIKLVD